VLAHCEDVDAGVAELLRVTRPGGRVVAFEYDYDSLTVDHPDIERTLLAVRDWSHWHRNAWSGRQLRRRFLDRGLVDIEVTAHTVLMAFAFFRTSVASWLAGAAQSGAPFTADELSAWWQPLVEAQAEGRFFASITGFVAGGTRPAE
jgi:SAM-dependent methyltransferase